MTQFSMLTLFIRIKQDPFSQALAATLKEGFDPKVRKALQQFGVRDARITSIPDAATPGAYEAILLSTTYPGSEEEYERFFFEKMPRTFILLVNAAVDAPEELGHMTPQQRDAIASADDSEAARAELLPLFAPVARFIEAHDLTRKVNPTEEPGEPPRRPRNQFVATEIFAGWGWTRPA